MSDWFTVRGEVDDQSGMKPKFDEIVTGPVDSVHIEQLSDQSYWMGIHRGGERLVVTFSAKNGRAHVAGRFDHE